MRASRIPYHRYGTHCHSFEREVAAMHSRGRVYVVRDDVRNSFRLGRVLNPHYACTSTLILHTDQNKGRSVGPNGVRKCQNALNKKGLAVSLAQVPPLALELNQVRLARGDESLQELFGQGLAENRVRWLAIGVAHLMTTE